MAQKDNRTHSINFTDRSSLSMALFLKEIRQTKPLSAKEEVDLASTSRKGGKNALKARERLIKANLRFVVHIANEYQSKFLDASDLVSEGNYGLIKAVEHFDETKGFKFSSYAVWWIRQVISAAVSDYSTTFRLPQNMKAILKQYRDMDKDMLNKEGRHITIDEFCEVSGHHYDKVAHILQAKAQTLHIDDHFSDDKETTLGDFIATDIVTDSNLDKESLRIDIQNVMNHLLTNREAFVVKSVMGIDCKPMPYEQVAEVINLTRERTRQIYHQALEKLRNSPHSSTLRKHLAA